ncbi:Extracellular dioxygenase [Phytophthora megakarya]|uniref:Extracellular dioxygenase n=1 Tax=Phytophthora megakarya TaxID=4795 RepID=A0A225X400_9STRA|nr:Extracellular dioxygenase [Phytophthora megakarya]
MKIATFLAATAIAACTLSNSASAHDEPARRQLSTNERRLFFESAQAASTKCTKSTSSRKLEERAVARRAQTVEKLRQQIGHRRLDAATVTGTSHKSSSTVTTSTTSTSLFASQTTVLVEPEVTQGPYYIKGEYIRTNMTEDQSGVPMFIDIQVVDVTTCNPVKNMYVDLWHANATGVYSGVVANSNGNSADTTNLKKTFLRGVTPTDSDGVAQMTSIFPGHYQGRATHLHFVGNHNGNVLSNKTYSGGSVVHVGQFFFDDSLISQVDATTPYSTNKQTITANVDDMWLKAAALTGYDPIMNYAWLSSKPSDGLFVWISLAVDLTATQSVTAVSTFTSSTPASGSSSGTTTTNSTANTNGTHSSSGSSINATTTTTNSALSKFGRISGISVALLAAFAPLLF